MFKEQLTTLWSRLTRKPAWRSLLSAAVLALSVGLLGYKLHQSWSDLAAYEWHLDYVYLLPSYAFFWGQLLMAIGGWWSIVGVLAHRLPYRRHLRIYGYTNLMRRLPAGLLWTTAGRAYAYRDQEISVRTSTVGSSLEFYLVILTALPLCGLSAWNLDLVSPTLGLVLAIAAVLIELLALHPAVLTWLLGLARQELPRTKLTYSLTLSWATAYTCVWGISGAGLFAVARLFGDIPIASLPAIVGAWTLANLVSYVTLLSPSGFGLKEVSLAFLLGRLLPDPLPLLTALGIRLLWTAFDLSVGLVALML